MRGLVKVIEGLGVAVGGVVLVLAIGASLAPPAVEPADRERLLQQSRHEYREAEAWTALEMVRHGREAPTREQLERILRQYPDTDAAAEARRMLQDAARRNAESVAPAPL